MPTSNFLSIEEAHAAMREGKLSPRALTEACYRQIERLNPALNAFITICDNVIAGEAKQSSPQEAIAATALENIPIAIKDLFETKGLRTTAGSIFFKDYIPDEDAVAVQKVKAAGAVVMGKTNTHEIALGVTTVNPHFGACRNPWDTARIAGGSSGGSAAAVASGMSTVALGTDTGGSIRIPASLCGVVGLKPTFGRVSTRGVFPLSWNLDHVGPLTRNVRDAALVLQVLAGYDADDPASANMAVDDYLSNIEDGIKGWRVAHAIGKFFDEADAEVLDAVQDAAEVFERLGAKIEDVEMSFLREAALANSLMTQADGAAYHRERLAERPDGFGADVRQRLETGRNYTSTEYILARRAQAEMIRRLGQFFDSYDILILPTTPITAPFIEGNDAVEQARRLTRFTAPFNLTGLPAITIPCGYDQHGLPMGLQIVSKAWGESLVLRAARSYERETGWGTRRPPLVKE
jgi:aspartyl-tRNA(Asn)/glutamyl-tRNA(Gln) amidotransferase subunit A